MKKVKKTLLETMLGVTMKEDYTNSGVSGPSNPDRKPESPKMDRNYSNTQEENPNDTEELAAGAKEFENRAGLTKLVTDIIAVLYSSSDMKKAMDPEVVSEILYTFTEDANMIHELQSFVEAANEEYGEKPENPAEEPGEEHEEPRPEERPE